MCMKGLSFLMWNFIMIYPLVLKIYRENLKISAITGRLPVHSLLKLMFVSRHRTYHFMHPVWSPGDQPMPSQTGDADSSQTSCLAPGFVSCLVFKIFPFSLAMILGENVCFEILFWRSGILTPPKDTFYILPHDLNIQIMFSFDLW